MIAFLFWGTLLLVLYTYVLFPLIVLARGRLFSRPFRERDISPMVSIVVAAYNEGQSIGAKLDNLLSLDYPPHLLDIVIASDGSSDDTDAIVRRYHTRGVRLLSLPRHGKARALNAGVSVARGTILVFSDANSMFDRGALRALVSPFADPRVGGVAGDQRYLKGPTRAATADGERCYWDLDRRLKQAQSRAGNVTSATGAIYAIRRSLFSPVPDGVTDDFVTSTRVIAAGYRLVFASRAIAFEPVAPSSEIEFGRKVRVISRGFQSVTTMRALLNPLRHGFYAVQLLSHKVLRRLVTVPLVILFGTSLLLWTHGPLYQAAALAQLLLYGCAALGLVSHRTRIGQTRILTLPFFFVAVNVAATIAAVRHLAGRRVVLWDPQRPPFRTN